MADDGDKAVARLIVEVSPYGSRMACEVTPYGHSLAYSSTYYDHEVEDKLAYLDGEGPACERMETCIQDVERNCREIGQIIFGDKAPEQPSICDIVAYVRQLVRERDALVIRSSLEGIPRDWSSIIVWKWGVAKGASRFMHEAEEAYWSVDDECWYYSSMPGSNPFRDEEIALWLPLPDHDTLMEIAT